jgi:methionyl-tRNA synthetase
VQGMLQRLFDEGKIYKDKQVGFYSVRQEQFLTDKDRNEAGEFSPEWGEVEQREEENYYFKLAEHKRWLLDFIDARSKAGNPFVVPDFRVAELRNAVEKLGDDRPSGSDRQSGSDLCISRPKSRLSWGIELPFDRDYVNYVWFDALSNYISFIGYDPSRSTISDQPSTFRDKWPALHVIGKDIMIPAHGIYWPTMLHALGFPDDQMPTLLVHGWWNISGAKMSKSLGNVVDPDALIEKYGGEAVRYYLMSDIVTGKDADFSEDRLVERYNSDLANKIGNLLNRTLTMAAKYCTEGLRTPLKDVIYGDPGAAYEGPFCRRIEVLKKTYNTYFEGLDQVDPCLAMMQPIEMAVQCNRFIEVKAPWKISSEAASTRHDVLYTLTESLRIIAILISPVLPKAAHRIFDQLNWKMELRGKEERFRLEDAKWGGLPDGHVVGKPVPLFPRVER